MAEERRAPARMCIACRQSKPKQELIRIIRERDGRFTLDATGKRQGGRGAYICADAACVEKAKKIFGKAMHCQMGDALYEDLMKAVCEHEKK
ncbi:hypothetical protein CE91St36_12050 [Christensenellaceae bacterium]|nr:hypothetical protein CE91St36_12050 [Christensenellaceae bacterium]BDF61056.1 hypothetical protein CE91St37_12060 [Christensenellaceae bacterium]